MEITPTKERLGGLVPAEYNDEAITKGQLSSFGVTVEKRIYKAILTQTSTNDPVATVFENTLGNIVWTRDSAGAYTGTLTGAFPAGKVYFHPFANYQAPDLVYAVSGKAAVIQFSIGRNSANSIYLNSFLSTADASDVLLNVAVDALLSSTGITIEVYN